MIIRSICENTTDMKQMCLLSTKNQLIVHEVEASGNQQSPLTQGVDIAVLALLFLHSVNI
jgi:hypothetical protein